MSTPRRRASVPAEAAQIATGPQGKTGPKGDPGLDGPSFFREISEASSMELFGGHPAGFCCPSMGETPLECNFLDWSEGDVLQVDFWTQIVSRGDARPEALLFQAQISLDAGLTWRGLSGARLHLSPLVFSGSASASVALRSRPQVRLFTAYGANYGPGPEGSTLLLRCTRWALGTYAPSGKLLPPLGGGA